MIAIYEEGKTSENRRVPTRSFLELYPAKENDTGKQPFMIVLPGGGYSHLADHEGRDVARRLNEMGIHAGVFYYQLDPADIALCLEQLDDLVVQLRQGRFLKGADPARVGIMGFSAGGHLAAMASAKNQNKPDISVLCYPVITMEEPFAHLGSRTNILGESPSSELIRAYSPEQWVDTTTPKTFVWHAMDDQSVPVENAWLYLRKLNRAGVPCEGHFFQEGGHGKGLAPDDRSRSQWVALLENWLQCNDFI